MKHYCNPINIEYQYQFAHVTIPADQIHPLHVFREAADPSLICFKGIYYLFPSMTAGFYTSTDLIQWELHRFVGDMPIYDYAPDVCATDDCIYFCASGLNRPCSFFRSEDPIYKPFEEIKGNFAFWDPNMFIDDDKRIYFYWGCSDKTPIWGTELDSDTMLPRTQPLTMFDSNCKIRGYERNGENHTTDNAPFIEGAWMTKHAGKYYLQYAAPATEFNTYNDGVFVSDSPLGEYELANNNPFSYQPGGFITGAGHGSTLLDKENKYWHISTMRVSVNYNYERRLGMWKAGFDEDGEMYCDQRYGDWPVNKETPPFSAPDWMLLSYGKKVAASSGSGEINVTDENIRTWWTGTKKADGKNCLENEWLKLDLGMKYDVRAVQINFADDHIEGEFHEGEKYSSFYEERQIDQSVHRTRWVLEGSVDDKTYFVLNDKRKANSDLAHDFLVYEEGKTVRYLRLIITEFPFHAIPAVSGIRVFGIGHGESPQQVQGLEIIRNEMDMELSWSDMEYGHNILWGHKPDKLYHSFLVYGENSKKIGALVADQNYYVRVDTFNENGITEGEIVEV